MNAIEVMNISKRYRLGEYLHGETMLREAITNFARNLRRRKKAEQEIREEPRLQEPWQAPRRWYAY